MQDRAIMRNLIDSANPDVVRFCITDFTPQI